MTDVKVEDRGEQNFDSALKVRIDGNPGALIFKEKERGILTATVCGNCGYTELQCGNLPALWSAYCKTK